ncbi:MAG TPA: SLBB domain-containing protein, partial [Ktedonobacteraceae bacterium]
AQEGMHTPPLPGNILPPMHEFGLTHKKKYLMRGAAILFSALLLLAIYLTWHAATPTSASPMVTQQTYSNLSSMPDPVAANRTATPTESANGSIQVYVVGAIKHPGVYILTMNARVYQLIKAAGGALPNANLVALNLAAKLTDGQEIYVLSIGEATPIANTNSSGSDTGGTPGSNTGSLLNINTATEVEMEQTLHVSATTAKKISAYRAQHGSYTAVSQLSQVVSQSIYNRIKNLVTV